MEDSKEVKTENPETISVNKAQLDALIQQNAQLKKDLGFTISFTYGIWNTLKGKLKGDGKLSSFSLMGNIPKVLPVIKEYTSPDTEMGKAFAEFQERYKAEIEEVGNGE